MWSHTNNVRQRNEEVENQFFRESAAKRPIAITVGAC